MMAPAPGGGRRAGPPPAVEWYDSVDVAAERMTVMRCADLAVLDGTSVIGHVSRDQIRRLERAGTWLGSVLVRDVMRRD